MGVYYSHYLIPRDNTVRPQPDRIVALVEAWLAHGFIGRPSEGTAPDEKNSGEHRSDGLTSQTGARFTTISLRETREQERASELPPRPGFWLQLLKLLGAEPYVAPPFRPWPRTPFAVPPVGESLSALAKPCLLIRWEGDRRAACPMQTVPDLSAYDTMPPPAPTLEIRLSDDFENCHTDGYGVGGDSRQVIGRCRCGCNLEYESAGLSFEGRTIHRICPQCGAAFRPQDQIADIVDENGNKTPQPGGMCYRFAIVVDCGKDHPLYVQDSGGELVATTPKVSDAFMNVCSAALGVELNEFGNWG
jgi:hypothetical protein